MFQTTITTMPSKSHSKSRSISSSSIITSRCRATTTISLKTSRATCNSINSSHGHRPSSKTTATLTVKTRFSSKLLPNRLIIPQSSSRVVEWWMTRLRFWTWSTSKRRWRSRRRRPITRRRKRNSPRFRLRRQQRKTSNIMQFKLNNFLLLLRRL